MTELRDAFMRNLWRWSCGLAESVVDPPTTPLATAEDQWDDSFEREVLRGQWQSDRRPLIEFFDLMRMRLAKSFYRYGDFRDPSLPPRDRMLAARTHVLCYACDGNLEHLVDAANMLLIERAQRRLFGSGSPHIVAAPPPSFDPLAPAADIDLCKQIDAIVFWIDCYREREYFDVECLIAARACMMEFQRPHHPRAHFRSVDDGFHAKESG